MDRGPRLLLCRILTEPPALTDRDTITPMPYPQLVGKSEDSRGREAWLEEALASHSDLLLVDRIDPHSGKLVLIGRQLEIPGRGALDLLFLELCGILTLVETKLAENSELRRAVFAQIMDYATGLADMKYEELERRVCYPDQPLRIESGLSRALWRASGHREESGTAYKNWSKEFPKTVEDNLRRRRIRLVIVADQVDHRLRDILEFNVGGARPEFQIALVEITPFKLPDRDDRLLLVPNLHWSHTPHFPPGAIGPGKIHWTEEAFLEQMRLNNAEDGVAVEMIERILTSMKERVEILGSDARLEWSKSTAASPAVNLWIRGVSNAIPHLGGVAGGWGWIACRGVRKQHPKPLRSFLERIGRLDPYRRLAEQLLNDEKNDFKITRDYAGDPVVREEVLKAMEELQDAIISGSR